MSQYGMQMPGSTLQRGPSLNVFTGLLALALVALIAACAIVFIQGAKIGPDGSAYQVHPFDANNKTYDIKLSQDPS